MTVFRLAASLVISLVMPLYYCLDGREGISTATRMIDGSSSMGLLLVEALPTRVVANPKPSMRSPATMAALSSALSSSSSSSSSSSAAAALASASTHSTTPIASAVRVAWVFPSPRERFRNITRAIEYSVVHDHDNSNKDGGEGQGILESGSGESLRRLTETCSRNVVEKYRTPRLRIGTTEDKDRHDPASSPFATAVLPERTTVPSWPYLVGFARGILRSFSLCWFVGKTKLEAWLTKGRNEGFSASDLGGTKRHYALLVASVMNGALGLGRIHGSGCSCSDPLAYHHTIVQSAHHRTVASLSPSTLAVSGIDNRGIPVPLLQRHALQWALNNNNKRKRKRKHKLRDQHQGRQKQ